MVSLLATSCVHTIQLLVRNAELPIQLMKFVMHFWTMSSCGASKNSLSSDLRCSSENWADTSEQAFWHLASHLSLPPTNLSCFCLSEAAAWIWSWSSGWSYDIIFSRWHLFVPSARPNLTGTAASKISLIVNTDSSPIKYGDPMVVVASIISSLLAPLCSTCYPCDTIPFCDHFSDSPSQIEYCVMAWSW